MCKIPKNIHPGYGTLIQEVLPKLQNFKEDVTKHDKEALVNYNGDFVSMYRETGTHLFKCDSIEDAARWTYKYPEESLRLTYEGCLAMVKANQNYIFVTKDGKFNTISKEEVINLIEARYEKAIKFYKESFLKMNFEGMANIIEFFMIQYGKRWKSNFIKEWESSYCSQEARRIRNHYGIDFLKTIKFQTEKEEI